MGDVSTNPTPTESLNQALLHEHREIDHVIKRCADGSAMDSQERQALQHAVAELRRHIFVEEELLFPTLGEAGMVGPILVMLREHAQMWPILDTLEQGLVDGDDDDLLSARCHDLFILLQHHNPKEERILYPQVDQVLDRTDLLGALEVLAHGRVPKGWKCRHLRAREKGLNS